VTQRVTPGCVRGVWGEVAGAWSMQTAPHNLLDMGHTQQQEFVAWGQLKCRERKGIPHSVPVAGWALAQCDANQGCC
jgi:hypothetical protein